MAYGFSAPGFSWHGFSTTPPAGGPQQWGCSPWFGSAQYGSDWWGPSITLTVEPPLNAFAQPQYRIMVPTFVQLLDEDELLLMCAAGMLAAGLLS